MIISVYIFLTIFKVINDFKDIDQLLLYFGIIFMARLTISKKRAAQNDLLNSPNKNLVFVYQLAHQVNAKELR